LINANSTTEVPRKDKQTLLDH